MRRRRRPGIYGAARTTGEMDSGLSPAGCPGMTANPLDTPTPRFVNRTLLALYMTAGRIAQRESVPFTRERSKVRSLVRPPEFSLALSLHEQPSEHFGLYFPRGQ